MYFSEAQAVLARISYKKGWKLSLHRDSGTEWLWWLQVHFTVPDMITGKPFHFNSRRWLVDGEHQTYDDIVGTAFLAIKTAEEHEVMEFFKLDGISIFNPHITPDARKAAFAASFPEKRYI